MPFVCSLQAIQGCFIQMVEEMPPLRSAGFVDPGWEHGTAQDEKKKKVKCNYCGKVVSGGIYRLKQHLARISGEVTYCERAPEEVFLKMRENLEGCRSNKKPRLSKSDERAYLNFHCHDNKAAMEDASYRRKGKKVLADKSLVINLTPLRSLGYVDPGWEHGVAQDERKRKVKCNYCGKIVSGGINRFKQHLARIPGEVAPCKYVPDEVYFKIKESMKWHRAGRRHRRLDVKEMPASHVHTDNELEEDEQEEDIVHHMEKEKVLDGDNRRSGAEYKTHFTEVPSGSDSQMCLNNCGSSNSSLKTPVSQIPVTYRQLKAGSIKKNQKEVLSAICQFFYHAGIPTSAANSLYFQKMLELVGQYGQGLSVPCSQLISGRLLQDEIATIKNHLPEFRACWAITGCSIVADSWKNTEGRTRINFLVSCPRGLYLVCSLDATDIADDASSLFKLLDKVVEEIGEENVVQVVTQSTPSYKAAGKMLEDKRKGLYWTPCVVYCIDQILEGFTKMKLVGECLANGQRITRFIYNHAWLLNLMKKEYTAGQELLRPAMTKCATGFGTLQCLVGHRIGLKRLFQSNKWLSSPLSKSDEGKEMETITLNATFWKKMQYVRKSVDPFLRVLQKVCSDGSLLMAYIHNDMHKAKLAIKSIHGDDARKYGPFWSVIDNHWSSLFHHPLCLAAYFLNPAFRYRPDYVANPEVMRGLNDCIVRLEQDSGKRISASIQISDFVSAKADFGTELAISTRAELDPAAWWQQHGISCLELQRIAVRILSQTCTAFGCEHNWSAYDHVYTERRNRLAQKKLSDLVYVHYNLRLREHQQRRINDKFSLDNVLMEGLLDDWIGEADKQVIQHDEDVLDIKDGYDSNTLDYKDGDVDIRKGEPLPMATLTEAEPLNVHPAADAATDDDSNLDFLDDGFSD